MAVLMSLGGNAAGDGFLVAPLGTTYEVEIALWTDAGTASVTLQASPNPANLVFSTAGPISISTVPTIVTVHAQLQSASRGDTTIQVLEGMAVVASFKVTSIKHPVVNFNGRFEARLALTTCAPISIRFTSRRRPRTWCSRLTIRWGPHLGSKGSRISCPLPAPCPRTST